MTNGAITSKLEIFARDVGTCNPQAIEDASNLGEDTKYMDTKQSVAYRLLLNSYKEGCIGIKVPPKARAEAESAMARARELLYEAETYVGPKVEAATPTFERMKKSALERLKAAKKTLAKYS